MRDITTGTTVPVTTPLRPPRAGKRKPTEEKTAPRHPVPAPTNTTSVPPGAAPGGTSGRFVLRAYRPVCRPLPARRLQAIRTGFCENISNTNPVKPEARLFPRVREGGSFFPPLFSLFLLFFISSWFFFFFLFLFFSFLSQRHTRGRTLRSPEKPDAQGVSQRCGSSPGHGKSHHARLQQGQFNYRKKQRNVSKSNESGAHNEN